ncbi:hypothetical protein [Methylobacterium sp. W2]|uniref:hypothetical protein n=1 Tax=Methylobacterium sp. W2 TaxID=2598107 RepID=UPI001D0BFEB0|nr:hypothetical protein [Methylobacterium sp. W2]
MNDQITSASVTVEYVTLRSSKPFETMREPLEAVVPPLDHAFEKFLLDGKVDEARDLLERLAPLSIVGTRDHGGVLVTAELTRKAIQYDTRDENIGFRRRKRSRGFRSA